MGLLEDAEDLKKQLKELEEKPEAEEIVEEEVKEEEPVEEEKPEPEVKEEKPEPKPEPKEELDDAGFARIRRENLAMKREIEALKAVKPEPVAETVEQPTLSPVLEEIVKDYQFNLAGQEFNNLEMSFKRTVPDYDDISNAYKADLYRSVKLDNPRWSEDMVLKETNKKLLTKASQYYNQGLDPIQEMYEDAKALGYKARQPEAKAEVREEKEIKPDMKKVADNRSRNSGMAGAKSGLGGQPDMTREVGATLPPAEWARLPASEKRRLLGMND